jgi:hypothetical protein
MGFPSLVFRPSEPDPSCADASSEFRQFIEQRIAFTITRTGVGRQPFFIK